MITKVFFCCSYGKREKYKDVHLALKKYLTVHNINLYSFVFDYTEKSDPKTMMSLVKSEIDSSDLILGELSDESVGVGLELGYAHGKGIKTVYLYNPESFFDPVVAGITDYVVEYKDQQDIINWFETNYFSNK